MSNMLTFFLLKKISFKDRHVNKPLLYKNCLMVGSCTHVNA